MAVVLKIKNPVGDIILHITEEDGSVLLEDVRSTVWQETITLKYKSARGMMVLKVRVSYTLKIFVLVYRI